jgi:hypothetical protein
MKTTCTLYCLVRTSTLPPIVHFIMIAPPLSIIHIVKISSSPCKEKYWLFQMGVQRCQITNFFCQNWINIYILSFKAMAIMASYWFFIYMNVKEFKQKIHLMKFWFRTFKSEYQCIKHESILQRTIKMTHIIKHIWWEKN